MNHSELVPHAPGAVAFLAAAVVGLAVDVVVAVRSGQMALREEEFVVQVNKLIAADNADRAAKLCAAAGARPVALLVGVGVDAILQSSQSGLRATDAVERAKMAMTERLPLIARALMPGVALAAAVACLTTALGALVLGGAARTPPWGFVIGLLAPVDGIAAWAIAARLRVRTDLARAVAEFGSAR